jgi:hypothetical protein
VYRAKGWSGGEILGYKPRFESGTRARRLEAGNMRGMWTTEPKKGIDTGLAAAGRPVRSIRKNNVLPGSGPTDLHFGKNDIVPTNFFTEI